MATGSGAGVGTLLPEVEQEEEGSYELPPLDDDEQADIREAFAASHEEEAEDPAREDVRN